MSGDDFKFDVMSADWEAASLTADELFDSGVIKPLNAFSPRRRGIKEVDDDIVVVTARNTTRSAVEFPQRRVRGVKKPSGQRSVCSLSPVGDGFRYPWKDPNKLPSHEDCAKNPSQFRGGHWKWRLKDCFFLFRCASEGRAVEKDPLRKYTVAALRGASIRAVECGSGSPPGSWRGSGPVSAHELHYMENRAFSQDLKKRTFLPYKQGILGRLAFNPVVHS